MINSKIIFTFYYFLLTITIWYTFWITFISIQSLNSHLFLLALSYILISPLIYINSKNVSLINLYIIFFCILLIIGLNFQKNQWIDWKFELICLNDCNSYNWNILNVFTENELLNMWFSVSKLLWVPIDQLNSFKDDILIINESIKIRLPSVIPQAISDTVINKQYFIYTPDENTSNKIIIFLHGSAGSFQYYQKIFKKVSDDSGVSIVSPIFGWWNWNKDGWVNLVLSVYEDLKNKNLINDGTEITIIWTSNWWRWLTRIISKDTKNIFHKIIFISWVIEWEITWMESFQRNIENKKILIIHWKQDKRVSFDLVNNFIESYKQYNIELLEYEEWDHFILWTQKQDILNNIINFIKK